jgi:hypothetical protein
MSRATLDIIGLAAGILLAITVLFLKLKSPGFNYKLNALSGDLRKMSL